MHLIIGASGRLGRYIAENLLQRGEQVKAVSRDPEKLASLKSKGAKIVQGDLRDPSWMDGTLRNVQYLFIAAHGLVPPSRRNTIDTVDDTGNRYLIDAAKRAGVQHIIFTSVHQAHPNAPMKFARIKYKIEEYLKASGVDYTIVRPSAFIETHAIFRLAEPIQRTGKVTLIGDVTTPVMWISAADVADYMVDNIENPEMKNSTKVISGPDILSQVQVIEIIEQLLGKKAKLSRIPNGFLHAVRILSRPLHPGISNLLEAALMTTKKNGQQSMQLDWTAPASVADVVYKWIVDTN